MRLWYQTFSRFAAFGQYGEALVRMIESAADTGTTIDTHDLSKGGIADQYRYIEYLDTAEVINNGLRAQREGYDAFLIGNIIDPGIRELRELLTIPVLGLCETTLNVSTMMGTSFSLISVNNKFATRVIENVRRYGHEPRLVSVEPMRVDHLPRLASGFSGARQDAPAREAIFDAFREAARAGIAKGAELIIPAGGVVMTMLANAGVYEVDGVPVLDGTIALTKMGETAVKLHRLTGTFTSKRMTYAPPGGNVLRDVRAAYGPDIYPNAG